MHRCPLPLPFLDIFKLSSKLCFPPAQAFRCLLSNFQRTSTSTACIYICPQPLQKVRSHYLTAPSRVFVRAGVKSAARKQKRAPPSDIFGFQRWRTCIFIHRDFSVRRREGEGAKRRVRSGAPTEIFLGVFFREREAASGGSPGRAFPYRGVSRSRRPRRALERFARDA